MDIYSHCAVGFAGIMDLDKLSHQTRVSRSTFHEFHIEDAALKEDVIQIGSGKNASVKPSY